MDFNKDLLLFLIKTATEGHNLNVENKFDDEYVNLAMAIFKLIKQYEKSYEFINELSYAKLDLKCIFDIENLVNEDGKKMTPNQIYQKHQSLLINAIVQLEKEDLLSLSLTYDKEGE